MKFELHQNSLFAILLRSSWWISALLALGVFALLRLFMPVGFAVFGAAPFIAIGIYGAIRHLRRPGPQRIAQTLERARAMPWEEFCAALKDGFRRDGFAAVDPESGADLVLRRDGLVTLVACKRWKAMRTGIEPLKEFDAATSERGAHARIYVAVGEVTQNAQAFAAEKRIRVMNEEDLARLLA